MEVAVALLLHKTRHEVKQTQINTSETNHSIPNDVILSEKLDSHNIILGDVMPLMIADWLISTS